MKLTQTFVLTSQLASIAAAEYYPTNVRYWDDYSETGLIKDLEGAEALSYLFDYDPSRRHLGDTGRCQVLNESTGIDNITFKYEFWSNYDTEYLARICAPRMQTGEADSAWVNSTSNDVDGDETSNEDPTLKYESGLKIWRATSADSPYPCERIFWLHMECGVNPQIYGENLGTFGEQNKCLCESDGYWAANQACQACYDFHTGDANHAAKEEEAEAAYSAAVCTETGTAAKEWNEISRSVRGIQSNQPPPNSTIVRDGAPGKTDVSLYYTGGVDFVPATIREPAFTRTVGEETVVMTPRSVVAKATAAATGSAGNGPTTGSSGGPAASTTAVTAGALGVKSSGCLMVAMFGALMIL